MKKAVLTISFGTSCADAAQSCILPVEQALGAAFGDWPVFRAYTSRIIVRKLRDQGQEIELETEAIARLLQAGYDPLCLASTHIIPGEEYELAASAAGSLKLSEPLLCSEEDLDWMAGLLGGLAREEGRPLVMMGHGTEHAADGIYARLREKLPKGEVFLACVEGAHTLDSILDGLKGLPEKRVSLMPLMLVAGDHARNDLAGDEPDSWKSILQNLGFEVKVRMQGLGALKPVQRRFVEKVRKILPQ